MKLVHRVFAVCLFTGSCDVILNFQLGGFLRLAQILLLLVCLAGIARIAQNGRLLWPRGGTALVVWLGFQILYIPLSGNTGIALKFLGLLLFTCAGVQAVVQIYGDREQEVEELMRLYMLSFVFVAAFGMIQFLLPIVGGPGLLVRQYIVYHRLPRISAFSYEPSYFATYMVMGWVMLLDLRLSKARIASSRAWKWGCILTGVTLFCSTSKTAWLFMGLEGLLRSGPLVWHGGRRALGKLHLGRLIVRTPRGRILLRGCLLVLVVLFLSRAVTRLVNPLMFLSGTGIGGTAAHSLNDRSNAFATTLSAWKASPWFGRSLGGVPIYIASRSGQVVHTMEEVRGFWGFPVLMDVLLASGVFGFIPFLVFLYSITFGAYRLAARHWPQERARWLRALARSMIFEWLILCTDQNLMRVYLWFHITMVMVIAYHLECMPAPEPVHADAVHPPVSLSPVLLSEAPAV